MFADLSAAADISPAPSRSLVRLASPSSCERRSRMRLMVFDSAVELAADAQGQVVLGLEISIRGVHRCRLHHRERLAQLLSAGLQRDRVVARRHERPRDGLFGDGIAALDLRDRRVAEIPDEPVPPALAGTRSSLALAGSSSLRLLKVRMSSPLAVLMMSEIGSAGASASDQAKITPRGGLSPASR